MQRVGNGDLLRDRESRCDRRAEGNNLSTAAAGAMSNNIPATKESDGMGRLKLPKNCKNRQKI